MTTDIEKLIERLRKWVADSSPYWSGADLVTEAIDALNRFEKRERVLKEALRNATSTCLCGRAGPGTDEHCPKCWPANEIMRTMFPCCGGSDEHPPEHCQDFPGEVLAAADEVEAKP